MNFQKMYFPLLLLVLLLAACGGPSAEETEREESEENGFSSNIATDDPQTIEEAVEEVRNSLKGDGELKEVVDFRALKELLPASLMGMDRTEHNGEKAGAFGMNMSTASAKYEDGSQSMEVSIIDFAGISGALSGMASWANIDVDRESDDGFERTIELNGYKAFEKYDSKRKYGELSVIVEDRFIVNIKGEDIKAQDMRKALQKIGLKKLAKLD